MGTDADELVDGIYDFTYSLLDAPTDLVIEDSLSVSVLIDGKVRVKVYDVIRQIPTIYTNTDQALSIFGSEFKDILIALLKYGIFRGMISNVCDANETEILNTLDTLERLTTND